MSAWAESRPRRTSERAHSFSDMQRWNTTDARHSGTEHIGTRISVHAGVSQSVWLCTEGEFFASLSFLGIVPSCVAMTTPKPTSAPLLTMVETLSRREGVSIRSELRDAALESQASASSCMITVSYDVSLLLTIPDTHNDTNDTFHEHVNYTDARGTVQSVLEVTNIWKDYSSLCTSDNS